MCKDFKNAKIINKFQLEVGAIATRRPLLYTGHAGKNSSKTAVLVEGLLQLWWGSVGGSLVHRGIIFYLKTLIDGNK